jgi:iron(III) transport system substrate-binding protein
MRVDVIDADAPEVMKASGIGMPFTTPFAANYPKHYMDPDRTWVVNRNSWQGIAWNTKLVSDADAPKSWEAAADPKWKGKLAWAESSGTGAPRLFTHVRKLWGEEKAMDYLKKLQANGVRTLPGSVRTVLDQVIAGEYAVGLSMSMHHIAESQSKGAPIAGISPAPQLARAQMLHYVKGGPHPHAGMLLVDYILSKDGGQAVYRDTGYNPAHPDVEPLPHLRWFTPKASGHADFLMAPEEVESYRGKSQDLYKSMFR